MTLANQRLTALLPLKFNSQRVPGKNFKVLNGRPLFQWILDKLLSVVEIDQVVINTDAREALLHSGLEMNPRILIRDRPQEIRGDRVSMNQVIKDDIENIEGDIFLMTHVTNPFLSSTTILKALDAFGRGYAKGEADSLFTVNKIQARLYDHNCTPINHDPLNLIQTQDLHPIFEENSCMYIFTRKSFVRANTRIGSSPIMFEIPKIEAIDIDTPEDWELAKAIANIF